MQGQDHGRWFGNTVALSGDGDYLASALWCDTTETQGECSFGGVHVYQFNVGDKEKWSQLGGDWKEGLSLTPEQLLLQWPRTTGLLQLVSTQMGRLK